MPADLPPRRELFCQEYIKDRNATQAAIRAGYSKETAQEQSSRLLSNIMVSERISALSIDAAKRNGITQDWVIQNLKSVAERCMQVEPVLDKDGNPTGEFVFQANGANKSLELLGKTAGLFNDKLDVSVTKKNINITIDLYGSGLTPEPACEAEDSVPLIGN